MEQLSRLVRGGHVRRAGRFSTRVNQKRKIKEAKKSVRGFGVYH